MADPECFMRIRKTKKNFKSKAKKSQKILDSVVNTARYIKNIYCILTLAIGARQLVVQEALETT